MAFLPERNFLEETLVTNYDLSNGISAFTSSDFSQFKTVSLQFNYTNSNQNNDFTLEQSNDLINWSDLSEQFTLPVGSGSFVVDKNVFSGKYIRVNFKSVGSGNITIILLGKR